MARTAPQPRGAAPAAPAVNPAVDLPLTAEAAPLFLHVPSLSTADSGVWDNLQYAWRATFHTELSDTVLETWPNGPSRIKR